MRAIQVTTWGQPPAFTETAPSPSSSLTSTQIQLKVLASGLHRLTRSQILGQHYSSLNAGLPYVPGGDGVGIDVATGKKYYFASIATGGGFAEMINVEAKALVQVSDDADAVQVAGLVNPGMSSWMALTKRTEGVVGVKKNWSVVILGVTSQSGKVAVHFARKLGAGRVVGVARDGEKMKHLGLDDMIVLNSEKPEASDWEKMGDVDVVLDYLYGNVAVECLKGLKSTVPTQFVQIGSMAGLDVAWPAFLFRSKNITIRGSGPGAWSMQEFAGEAASLVKAVEGLEKQPIKSRKLEEVQQAWEDEKERTVFVP